MQLKIGGIWNETIVFISSDNSSEYLVVNLDQWIRRILNTITCVHTNAKPDYSKMLKPASLISTHK